jgi:large subunit ribosomal protein L19
LQPKIKTQPLTLDIDAGNVAQKFKIMDLIKIAEQAFATEAKNFPVFKAGDTITVTYRIKEENKERLQKFRGVCIQRKGAGVTQTFTVRKISNGIGVERIFPLTSPFIENIELNKVGKVRRARIFYLRKLTGKKARIKEKKMALIVEENTAQEQ